MAAILPDGGIPHDESVNQILIASSRPIDEPLIRPTIGEFVPSSRIASRIDGAMPLTDDHAPVDQMLLR